MEKDVCLNCGKEHESKVYGAKCDCKNPDVVHKVHCSSCNKIMGILLDDDYVDTEVIYCVECMKYFLKKAKNEPTN